MPKSKIQKEEILKDLTDKIKRSKSIIFTGFNALGVHENEDLRHKLRQEEGEYYVAKKTLLERALKDEGMNDLDTKTFDGKLAVIFSYRDEVSPAKVIDTFRKDKEDKIFFLGGIMEGKLLSQSEVETLAKLPTKQELLSKLVGSLNAPISGFVNVLAGNLRGLVTVLKAIEEQK